jgi:AraC-like DNA-binding protein
MYRESLAPEALRTHVACVWSRNGPAPIVVPDGCVDLVWTGGDVVVAGPATRSFVPRRAGNGTRLGIRFRMGAAGAALGVPASELLDSNPSLDEVWRHTADWPERIAAAPGATARLATFLGLVGPRLAEAPEPDPLARAGAVQLARPRTGVGALARGLFISERQLRRRFDKAVGYSPRTLARVLRLQRFLSLADSGRELARAAADAGYADQPHLTRDCRRLTGLPAAALLAAGAGPAGERLS